MCGGKSLARFGTGENLEITSKDYLSSSTGYAVISIRTAWLSYYYPLEFMTALLNSNINKNDKLEYYVAKIKSLGFNLLGPDVNKSEELFSISYEEEAIRFGLRGIKGLGKSSVPVIGARGMREFTSLTDFTERLNDYFKCDKKILENIAKCGGFESIEPNRKAIVESAEMIVNSLKKTNSKNIAGQMNLFDVFGEDESISNAATLQLIETEDYTKDEKLFFEKDLLSFYVSGHPLDKYDKIIREADNLTFTSEIKLALEADDSDSESFGFSTDSNNTIEDVMLLGQISEIKEMITKKGDAMCRLVLEDKYGEIGCVVFPKVRTAYRSKIIKGEIVVISGKAVRDDFGTQVLVSDISSPHILSSDNKPSTVILKCPFSKNGPERENAVNMFKAFKRAVDSFQEEGSVEALFLVDGETFNLGTIPSDVDVLVKLRRMFGEDKLEFIA